MEIAIVLFMYAGWHIARRLKAVNDFAAQQSVALVETWEIEAKSRKPRKKQPAASDAILESEAQPPQAPQPQTAEPMAVSGGYEV